MGILWRTTVLTLALTGAGLAQSTALKTRVEGHVTDQSGKPLGKTTVALVGNNRTPASPLAPAYTTTSAADGSFGFDNIEPNAYRIFAERAGYLGFVYTEPDGRVSVEIGEGVRKSIEIKMKAPSFFSGKVTDEDGEPYPDARVTVFRATRVNGKTQLGALSPITAGRDGGYATGRLTPGRYYVAASDPPSLAHSNQREINEGKGGEERYVTTYYPSALDTSAATPVDLAPGTELRNMDIRLRRARVFHVYGRIVNASGAPVPNATVNLLYPGVNDPVGNAHQVFAIDGAFEVNGLLPGSYAFRAWSGALRELQGHQTVSLSDRDIDNLTLTLAPGLEIPLSVQIEGADPQQSQKIRSSLGRFTLTASDGVNTNAMAQAQGDGWIFHNIGPGTYRMGLGGPDGTYVKSIRFGNRDVTRSELDTSSSGGALEMVLSAHAAEVAGVISDSNGQPLPGVTVTLWTPGLPLAGTLDQARSALTDAAGHFRFGNLRPGEYRVAAWEKIAAGLGNLPAFHVRFDDAATSLKLTEDSRETVQPVLIGRERVEAEAAGVE